MKKGIRVLGAALIMSLIVGGTVRAGEQSAPKERIELTPEEREYVEEAGVIGVSVSTHKGPIQYWDEKTGELKGISVDLFREIEKLTGLNFQFYAVDGVEPAVQMMRKGQVELLSGVPDTEGLKEIYDCEFSRVYMDAPIAAVMERTDAVQNLEDQTLALTVGLEVSEDFKKVQQTLTLPSIEECIDAVAKGRADITYGNAYVMEYYTQSPGRQGLTVVPLSGREQRLCVGVAREADGRLLPILDKAIGYLSENRIQQIIMNNAAHSVRSVTLSALIAMNPVASFVLFTLSILLILAIAFFVLKSYRKKNMQILMANRRYSMMAAISNEYFYDIDIKNDRLILSESTAKILGAPRIWENWSQMSKQFLPARTIEETEEAEQFKNAEIGEQDVSSQVFQVQIPVVTGQERWFRIIRVTIHEAGAPIYIIGKMVDIQEEHEEKQSLLEKSRRDSLTRLYNAATSREMIAYYLEQDRKLYGSLMIMDIDRFKNVNDRYGHYTGDKVLKAVADILVSLFRTEDIVGRLGGDEFVVFMKKVCDPRDVANKCRDIRNRIREISVGNEEPLSVSIGVVIAPKKVEFSQLYEFADKALYEVKENGRDDFKIVS